MTALAITQNNFVTSIEILDNVVNILSDELDEKKAIRKLTSLIPKAHKHLTEVLNRCQGETDRVSREIEGKVSEISKTKNDIAEKQRRFGELRVTLNSLDERIGSCKNQRDEAQRSLDRANQRLREQRDELERKREGQTVATVLGVLTAPIGIGIGILAVSLTVLEDGIKATERNVDSTRSDVRSCENTLTNNLEQRRNIEQQRCREEEEMERTKRILANLKADLAHLKEQQDKIIVVHEKLKESCHFVTTLWGKSRVLDKEAKHLYTLESLFIPLSEIAGMLQMDEESREKVNMLLTKDMKVLGKGMESKMMAICQSMRLELDLV
jgi:septal ring factor EnvC (AmiA/AmiB activator)